MISWSSFLTFGFSMMKFLITVSTSLGFNSDFYNLNYLCWKILNRPSLDLPNNYYFFIMLRNISYFYFIDKLLTFAIEVLKTGSWVKNTSFFVCWINGSFFLKGSNFMTTSFCIYFCNNFFMTMFCSSGFIFEKKSIFLKSDWLTKSLNNFY